MPNKRNRPNYEPSFNMSDNTRRMLGIKTREDEEKERKAKVAAEKKKKEEEEKKSSKKKETS